MYGCHFSTHVFFIFGFHCSFWSLTIFHCSVSLQILELNLGDQYLNSILNVTTSNNAEYIPIADANSLKVVLVPLLLTLLLLILVLLSMLLQLMITTHINVSNADTSKLFVLTM